MTDTPETDGAERESIAAYIEEYGPDAVFPCDGYDHARKLERERDEARERADTMFAKHVDILDQTRNERDELIRAGRALKTAKGRFHTEQAAINLFNLLP